MAQKFSLNPIADGDYSADWGNDAAVNLPYSGKSVQKFIKDELKKKYEQSDVEREVANQISDVVFGKGNSNVVTGISGNSSAINYTYRKFDGSAVTEGTGIIDISKVDVNDRFITVTSQLSSNYINVGGECTLFYGFAITDYSSTVIENQYASGTLNLYRQGSAIPFYTTSLGNIVSTSEIGRTSGEINLTSILKQYVTSSASIIATVSFAHTYTYQETEEGSGIETTVSRTINGQSSTTITVISIILNTGINIATLFNVGQISIPYNVRGNGSKSIYLYKNGQLLDSNEGITSINFSNNFTENISLGRTNYQLVAEAIAGNTTVTSQSYYFDLLVPASGTSISLMFEDSYGEIKDNNSYMIPNFKSPIYETFNIRYFVYNANSTTAPLTIVTEELDSDDNVLSTNTSVQTVARSVYTFSKRLKSANKYRVTLESGNTSRIFYITPQVGTVAIELPTAETVLNLDADGRSNEEINPAAWSYGDYSTEFKGVNFEEDGWVEDEGSKSLLLQNGAKAIINCPLFAPINGMSPANSNGCTFEILLKVKNVSTDKTPIASCLWENNGKMVGLNITSTYLGVNTGDQRKLPTDKEEEERYEDVSVGQAYSANTYYKYTFVVDKLTDEKSCYKAYINGVLSYAVQLQSGNLIMNSNNLPIVIDSTAADVYIKSIKYYTTALSHNDCVNSAIVDKSTVAEIEQMYNDNDIYKEDAQGKQYVSPEKIYARGRGVMIFSPSVYQTTRHTLAHINDITNKKSKGYTLRIDYYAPKYCLRLDGSSGNGREKGEAFNFTHLGCDVTIQGTTSANRPRKNYRINFNKNQECTADYAKNGYRRADGELKQAIKGKKGDAYKGDFIVGGKVNNKCKYSIDPDTVATARVCLKTDYVDSSMIHNTGGALVFNELTKAIPECQNAAQKHDSSVRVAIDGFPIDIFMAEDVADVIRYKEAGELSDDNYTGLKYMGQYNFNNDKSKTGAMFGFDNYDNGCYAYDIATTIVDGAEHFDPAHTTGEYNKDGKGEAICLEFLNNTKPLNVFWTNFDLDGNVSEDTFNDASFTDTLEMRAPACLTDFIGGGGDFKNTWKSLPEGTAIGGLDALYLDKATLAKFEKEGGTDYASGKDAEGNPIYNGEYLAKFRWIADCVKRPFKFIAECVKEVATANGVTVAQLNKMVNDNKDSIVRTNAFEAWDWTSNTFKNNAGQYFNMSNICMWYIWTDYLIAVDQRAKNMMFYTHDGLHWMFQYYDGDTVLGETNDCALAYDYLTTRNTFDTDRGQYAFQGHSSWLWYLVRANFASTLSSVCNEMRSKSNRFSIDYLKEVFNNQIVGNWNERLYNESQQYKYIDQLTDQFGSNRASTTYMNTIQGSRLAHRNYLIENRFAMLDAQYQTDTWKADSMIFDLTGSIKITSAIPYTFGQGRMSRDINEVHNTNQENNYTITLNPNDGSANEPTVIYGSSRILTFKAQGALRSTSESNPATFRSPVIKKLDLQGVTGGNYIALNGTSSLEELYIKDSSIATVNGLLNCKKLRTFNALNSPFTNFQAADGSPIQYIYLNAPQTIVLSNNANVVYGQADVPATLQVTNWSNLANLVLNNCPNINEDALLDKFFTSTASNKAIRYENIDRVIPSLEWLDRFLGMNGLVKTSLGDYTVFTGGPILIGTVTLADYTDDALVEEYRAKFPDLTIKQPEFTMIRCQEVAADASFANIDNGTGYGMGTNNPYVPSGHIMNILNRVHRYLGKVTSQGSRVKLIGNPNDNDSWGQEFYGRNNDGQMLLIQLADENSKYYATGYNSISTRKEANLSGTTGNGEVGVYIPGFWYKGINYHAVQDTGNKYNFTCYSSQTDRPTTSKEIKVLKVDDLLSIEASTNNDKDGLYAASTFVYASTSETDYQHVRKQEAGTRLQTSAYCNVLRIKVKGYKKLQFPVSINVASVFTDANYNVLRKSNTSGSAAVSGYSQMLVGSTVLTQNGMPVITTIPEEAEYFFLSVKTNNVSSTTGSGSIRPEYCNIVMHKGSNFANGDAMNVANAKDWLADMEPDWVYSDPVWIAAAECVAVNEGNGNTLYSPFDGTQTAKVGSGNTAQYLDPGISQEYCQYYFRYLAEKRGMQLIDYEASKLIAMLFFAKYGKKNSQNQLGSGIKSQSKKLGATATMGIKDTICKDLTTGQYMGSTQGDNGIYNAYDYAVVANGSYIYTAVGSPNFLGIENVSGNVSEYMDRVYYSNESPEHCSKLRITMPDNTIRRVLTCTSSGNFPKSLVHGRYCDIANCGSQGATNNTGYADQQIVDATQHNTWITAHAVGRSASLSSTIGGILLLYGGNSVAKTSNYDGSRLMFRGNFTITNNITEFENALDDRSLADD